MISSCRLGGMGNKVVIQVKIADGVRVIKRHHVTCILVWCLFRSSHYFLCVNFVFKASLYLWTTHTMTLGCTRATRIVKCGCCGGFTALVHCCAVYLTRLRNTQIIDTCVVFKSWHIRSNAGFFLSLVAIVLLGVFFEWLRSHAKRVDQKILAEAKGRVRLGSSRDGSRERGEDAPK